MRAQLSAQAFLQYALDFLFHHRLHHRIRETQFGGHPDLARKQLDTALDTTARETQGIAVPVIDHLETLGQFVGHGLHDAAHGSGRQGMVAGDVNHEAV